MEIRVRPYLQNDYREVARLYRRSELYGGQFDENRDAEERLLAQVDKFSDAIQVAIDHTRPFGEQIVGTVSLVDDGRVAWLFRFAVDQFEHEADVAKALYERATEVFASRGHRQVLVYTPVGNERLAARYTELGLTRGGDFTCFWSNI